MPDLTTRAVLEHNFMFCGLRGSTLDALAVMAHRRMFDKGSTIFYQGDEGNALFGVASGRVRIYTADDKGHEVFLNILGPGDTFGEIAVLDGLPRTASAVAAAHSTLIIIPRSQFLSYLKQDSGLSLHLMKLLCERLRCVSDQIEESVFFTGPARVAKRLSRLVEMYGRPLPDGDIELLISQAELGHFLGISRQIINQYLGEWCEQRWLRQKRGRIIVHDLGALNGVAAQHEPPYH
jgi:CRP/FNR family cyclic AMP-dependent transcriptional regulator